MIPFRPTDERVWLAVRQLRSEQKYEQDYSVAMNHETYADVIRTYRRDFIQPAVPNSPDTIFGLPIVLGSGLTRGQIVLRHEVKA